MHFLQAISTKQLPDLALGCSRTSQSRNLMMHKNKRREPGSKLLVLGMVIQPLIGNPYNGYINPYYWVDDHPVLYENNVSLDPSTHAFTSAESETKNICCC